MIAVSNTSPSLRLAVPSSTLGHNIASNAEIKCILPTVVSVYSLPGSFGTSGIFAKVLLQQLKEFAFRELKLRVL
jgi:hypothetical protein